MVKTPMDIGVMQRRPSLLWFLPKPLERLNSSPDSRYLPSVSSSLAEQFPINEHADCVLGTVLGSGSPEVFVHRQLSMALLGELLQAVFGIKPWVVLMTVIGYSCEKDAPEKAGRLPAALIKVERTDDGFKHASENFFSQAPPLTERFSGAHTESDVSSKSKLFGHCGKRFCCGESHALAREHTFVRSRKRGIYHERCREIDNSIPEKL